MNHYKNIPLIFQRKGNLARALYKKDDHIILAQYLEFWHNSEEIREELLPDIEAILDLQETEAYIGADVVGIAFIQPEQTQIIDSEIGYAPISLPTVVFKQIVENWVHFLEETKRD